jgi:hypothetical protein
MFLSALESDNFSPFILEVPFGVNYYAKRILRQAQDWWRMAKKGVNHEQSWNRRVRFTLHRLLFTERFASKGQFSWVL